MQALQQITSSVARASLEWHMDQHDAGLVGMLCLDHIALPPQAHHHLMASHFDLASDEPSSDEDMEVSGCQSTCLLSLIMVIESQIEAVATTASRLH